MKQTAQDFFTKAITLCHQNELHKAIELLDQSLLLEPSHTEALYNRAKCHFKLKKFEMALADFDVLVKNNPNNAFYLSERAVAFHLSGNNDKALEDLDRAVALEPAKPFRYSSRAFIKERSGDLHGAIADYEKTIALDPEDAIAFNNKGLVEEKLGYKGAKASFRKADELDPAHDAKAKATSSVNPSSTPKKEPEKTEEVEEKISGEKLTVNSYLKLVKNIITTKKESKAFKEFLKNFISKKL